MKKLIFLIFLSFILSASSYCFAETYYMAKTGLNSNDGSTSMPWLTLSYAMSQMSGGDTLIIRNGTYTGTENSINTVKPPIGSASNFTKIKAENDGQVVFDGENAREMFHVNDAGAAKYWQFEGIIWGRSSASTVYSNASYIKFLRCGAYDAAAGNNVTWGAAANGASYVLFEDCYSWGTGRYKFIAGSSNHIIFRRCVARPDGISAGGEPIAGFAAYSANYVAFQNCIVVDADQTSHWYNIGDYQGCFFVPTTSAASTNISFDQCIGLKSSLGGLEVAVQYSTTNIFFRNTIIWDSKDPAASGWLLPLRNSAYVSNCTIGNSSANANYIDAPVGSVNVTNSIIYGNTISNGYIFSFTNGGQKEDYNAYYSNNTTKIYGQSMGEHSTTTINPMNNSLIYLPRIEGGSDLSGAGQSGANIGATVMTLIGKSGTLWGESGYATDTGVSMWPFPNENLIKTKMASYSNGGVSGARGFCAGNSLDGTSQTLTKYIWEYLGNQIPSDIYAVGDNGNVAPTATVSADPNSGTVPLGVNFTGIGSDYDGTIASYTWSFGDGGTSTEQSPTHTYTSEGNYTATLTVTDNDGGVGTATVGVVVSATDSTVTGGSTSSEETISSVEKLINFQPSGATIPDGYSADTGAVYNSTRGYGWDQDISTQVRDRLINPDQRLDTFVYTDDVHTWKISLANGQYLVTIVCGDAENARGDHRVLLQGTEIINASTQANQFITVEDHAVTVSDGYLTVQAGGGNPGGDAYGITNLNYIIIKSSSGTSPEQVQGVVIVK